ncbi:MAG: GyrI-like domain-containing protein [Thermoleophilia bacterium]
MTASTPPGSAAQPAIGEAQLRHILEFQAVVLTTQGPYGAIADTFKRLRAWTDSIGVDAIGNVVALFYGRPPFDEGTICRYSLCLPTSKPEAAAAREVISGVAAGRPAIAGALKDHAGTTRRLELATAALGEAEVLDVRNVPPILAASVFYRGPVGGTTEAYARAGTWVSERAYLPAGAPREVYLAQPGLLGPGIVEAEIQLPVLSKGR